MAGFLSRLKRITSTGLYIPEIDGLRFLAIALIFLFHLNSYLAIARNFNEKSLLQTFFYNGYRGVELFFVISGFILSLPFAKHYLSNGKIISLKNYFLRRFTRLEPPYFIIMIFLFFVLVLTGTGTFSNLLPHLGASLLYTHNIFYPGNLPVINSVAWSLELEIQFYILIPFIARIFLLKKIQRRLCLLLAICGFPILQHYWKCEILFFYQFLQYPLVGFLLADLFINQKQQAVINKSKPFIEVSCGFILLLFIILLPGNREDLLTSLFLPLIILTFYWFVLFNPFWKKLFSIQWLTTIGGMCYSIYLIHLRVLDYLGHYFLNLIVVKNYYLFLIIQFVILGSLTFIIGALYFYFIERPCMKKNWHNEIIPRFKKSLSHRQN